MVTISKILETWIDSSIFTDDSLSGENNEMPGNLLWFKFCPSCGDMGITKAGYSTPGVSISVISGYIAYAGNVLELSITNSKTVMPLPHRAHADRPRYSDVCSQPSALRCCTISLLTGHNFLLVTSDVQLGIHSLSLSGCMRSTHDSSLTCRDGRSDGFSEFGELVLGRSPKFVGCLPESEGEECQHQSRQPHNSAVILTSSDASARRMQFQPNDRFDEQGTFFVKGLIGLVILAVMLQCSNDSDVATRMTRSRMDRTAMMLAVCVADPYHRSANCIPSISRAARHASKKVAANVPRPNLL